MALNEKMCICESCLANNKNNNANALYSYIGYHTILKVPEDKICLKCGTPLKEYNVTKEEFTNIYKISKESEFIKAMMELHDTDIIEFQLKMSQFKVNLEQQESAKAQTDNRPKCPTCGSTKIKKVSTTSKAVSVGLFGLFSQKVKKTWHCNNCGYEW